MGSLDLENADIFATRAKKAAAARLADQINTLDSAEGIASAREEYSGEIEQIQDNATKAHERISRAVAARKQEIRDHFAAVQNRLEAWANRTIEALQQNATKTSDSLHKSLERRIQEINERLVT